jgi:hypothetical protein
MSYFGYPLYPVAPTTQLTESNISGTTTLGAGAATYNKAFFITGAGGYTITLPALDPTNYPTASFSIFNNATSLCTINVAGATSDTMLLLGSSYTSVSILPGERFLLQNMQTSWVVALESASRTTTAPQFDNTIRTASTAFVQAALGNYQTSYLNSGTNVTLTAAQAGGFWDVYGTATITLPLTSSVPLGACYSFSVGALVTFTCSGSDNIYFNDGNTATASYTPTSGIALRLVKIAAGEWLFISEGRANASLAVNGYQKLPSGLIIQWGNDNSSTTSSTVTFPIAFPNAVYQVYASIYAAGTAYIATPSTPGPTLTQMTIVKTASLSANWLAIGR